MRRVLRVGDGSPLASDAVHQLDALVEDLASAGFDPLVDEDALTLDLTPCAHADADDDGHRDRRCAVHLGLMQSVLAEAGGPLAVEGMRPTCDPTQCVVQLIARP